MFKKPKILPQIKMKHLSLVSSNNVDYAKSMVEIVGYRNSWLSRKFTFAKQFAVTFLLMEQVRNLDLSKAPEHKDCKIARPSDIDFICFQAMMELQALFGESIDDSNIQATIIKGVAISTYELNNDDDYTSDSDSFKQYELLIANQPLLHIMGLFNWISRSIDESSKMWSERFASVLVEDEDYDMAGGDRMAQFNVITTIKAICSQFNVPFEKAWLMSYSLIQTNSYAAATASRIQDDMRILKEAKLRAQQKQN